MQQSEDESVCICVSERLMNSLSGDTLQTTCINTCITLKIHFSFSLVHAEHRADATPLRLTPAAPPGEQHLQQHPPGPATSRRRRRDAQPWQDISGSRPGPGPGASCWPGTTRGPRTGTLETNVTAGGPDNGPRLKGTGRIVERSHHGALYRGKQAAHKKASAPRGLPGLGGGSRICHC